MTGKDYDVERRLNDLMARGILGGLGPIKQGDTSRSSANSGTTLTADPDLVVTVEANAWYRFELYLNFEGANPGLGDFKWTWTVPSAALLRYQHTNDLATTHKAVDILTVNTNGPGNLCAVTMRGSLQTASTAGPTTLLWAQNVLSATSTILHGGSWMEFKRKA